MPSHPSPRSLQLLLRRPQDAYICPSCSFRSAPTRTRRPQKLQLQFGSARRASTVASVTAVNVKKDIPPSFRELHDALNVLHREAAVYTNLSQLQLALRGLESENGVVRIAVSGGADGKTTRRLVKALLVDPLGPESAWERQLSDLDASDGRALILRYGEKLELDQSHPLVRTLQLPSNVLHNHNLEVLIQAANTQSDGQDATAQKYLVPGLETPSSATGRYSTVTYPVHKALVVIRSLEEIRALSSVRSSNNGDEGEMITPVLDTSWGNLSAESEATKPIAAINLDQAEEAIAKLRTSLDNSFDYEHAWFDSGLPRVSAWFIEGTEALPAILKPTIRRLIETLAANAEHTIESEEADQLHKQASSVVSTSTRELMNTFIVNWAEAAHTELRDELDLAFSGRNWRRLAWWKLAWRVDDVTYITSDILRRSWLVDADRGILYLAGRIEQAGLLPSSSASSSSSSSSTDAAATSDTNPYSNAPVSRDLAPTSSSSTFASTPPTITFSDMFPASYKTTPSPTTHPLSLAPLSSSSTFPIPSISHHRTHILLSTIPPLQSLSQRLLLHALSTTFLTSSLSALVYVSVSTTSMYEAGAVAAVGAVLSARRLQKRWEGARERWESVLREEGRKVLRGVEEGWRGVVRDGGMGMVGKGERDGDGEGVEVEERERERARVAIRGVREALGRMEK